MLEWGKKPGKQKEKRNYISFHDLKCSNVLDGERSSIIKKKKRNKNWERPPG
jgi:hypothetical protein